MATGWGWATELGAPANTDSKGFRLMIGCPERPVKELDSSVRIFVAGGVGRVGVRVGAFPRIPESTEFKLMSGCTGWIREELGTASKLVVNGSNPVIGTTVEIGTVGCNEYQKLLTTKN